jgi:branched-subunit amino acid transport protein AzlD
MSMIYRYLIGVAVALAVLLPFSIFRSRLSAPSPLVVGAIGFVLAFTPMFLVGIGNYRSILVLIVSTGVGVVGFAAGYVTSRVLSARAK